MRALRERGLLGLAVTTSVMPDDTRRTLPLETVLDGSVYWPLMADGEFLCQGCTLANLAEIGPATLTDDADVAAEDRQWRIVGAQEPAISDTCAHCGMR